MSEDTRKEVMACNMNIMSTLHEIHRFVIKHIAAVKNFYFSDDNVPEPQSSPLIRSMKSDFYFKQWRPLLLGNRDQTTIQIKRSKLVLQYEDTILKAANKHGLPPAILSALIHAESSGRSQVKANSTSATGLGQLVKGTAIEMGLRVDDMVDERLDPEKNIYASAKYLSKLNDDFGGDITKAIMAYHEGPGNARKIIRLIDSGAPDYIILNNLATNKETGRKDILNYMSNVISLAGAYSGIR